ncbi:MAG: ABC transporter permease [Defluviitaleaceae bacterium]|nr:ABC transporter permease [Defluviitaleaceae bacterium]
MDNDNAKNFGLETGTIIDEKEFKRQNRIPSMMELIWKEIRRDPFAIFSVLMFITLVVIAFVWGNLIDEAAVSRIAPRQINLSPAAFGSLGTDESGRPMLQMLIISFRNSMQLSFMVTVPIIIIGTFTGLFIGYYGGYIDLVVLRIIDTIIMVPNLMVIAFLSMWLNNWGVREFAMTMVLMGWFGGARGLRARVLQEAAKDYVLASKTLGTPNIVIIFKKIFPNVLSFIMVSGILTLASMIGFEAGLTAIGFGLPFGVPSIGRLISLGMNPIVLANRQWQWVPAVLLIFFMSISILGIGTAVSRAVNPRQRR